MFLNNFNFEKLLAPVSKETFYSQHFGLKQLLIKRQDKEFYQGLLDATMLDELLFYWPNLATVVKADKYEGRRQDMQGNVLQFNTATVLNELDKGNTLIFDRLDNRIPSLSNMHALLEKETHYTFQSNIYITPPAQQGFRAHFDDHHVFILQTHGSKRWRVNNLAEPMSTPGDKAMDVAIDEQQHQAFMLEPGDILYIPPYTVHEAAGQDEYSVHITLSPYPPTYKNIIHHFLNQLEADHPINRPLPIGYLNADDKILCQQAKEGFDAFLADVVSGNLERFKQDNFNNLRGLYFGALAERISPTVQTHGQRFKANAQLSQQIHIEDDKMIIRLPKKDAEFPALFEPSIRYCLASSGFTSNDIPEMDAEEAHVLICRLLAEGLIVKAD